MSEATSNQQIEELDSLTEQEAFELAEVLKQKLTDQETPRSDQTSIKQMIAGLGDQRGALRLTFAQSLGNVGEAAVPYLCDALKNNPNVIIRRASAKTLNLIGSRKALPNLVEAFKTDSDPVVQGSSAGAMATIGVPAIDALLQILVEPDCTAFQVGLINLALSFIGSKAPDAFDQATQSDNVEIRIAAITVLAEQIQEQTSNSAKIALIKALSDEASEVRAEAATMAGKILEPEDASNQLCKMLKDKSKQVRKNTSLALMKMEAKDAIDRIKDAIKTEKDEQVKSVMTVAVNVLNKN
ncbi:putative phycoerythrobilin:C-phycoerythrin II lyase-isomerase [Synechococcus sp. BIOS-E4-1]|uniref:HEAT repeat domain-containing protein n=1 Tax=Synechococcus sp. BIOS-E4-1 TaxID=1400864 RepID=UPI0009C1EA30|nr:HEAT repeat domain-containing protein [Synechococcus sp. BIOS-E4-1]AQY63486.1 putative phycoerythrobilin:C-phycoerythrin lyase-isomerase [Synechococcus sp. BIOS-E4-1]QNI53161.1 putative phycoerythrobilin:C-phycoerythrin II lyase-isomerase [Synechococcus sp. BIOS-E4-1]